MNRKTAIATAVAITMSLTSGVVALSANAGGLGLGGSAPVAATQGVATAGSAGVRQAASSAAPREGEHDDGAPTAQLGAQLVSSTKGEHND